MVRAHDFGADAVDAAAAGNCQWWCAFCGWGTNCEFTSGLRYVHCPWTCINDVVYSVHICRVPGPELNGAVWPSLWSCTLSICRWNKHFFYHFIVLSSHCQQQRIFRLFLSLSPTLWLIQLLISHQQRSNCWNWMWLWLWAAAVILSVIELVLAFSPSVSIKLNTIGKSRQNDKLRNANTTTSCVRTPSTYDQIFPKFKKPQTTKLVKVWVCVCVLRFVFCCCVFDSWASL